MFIKYPIICSHVYCYSNISLTPPPPVSSITSKHALPIIIIKFEEAQVSNRDTHISMFSNATHVFRHVNLIFGWIWRRWKTKTGWQNFFTSFGFLAGILRNASRPPPPEAQQARGGAAVVVQRVINSAGQPRKVMLPVSEAAGSGGRAMLPPQASMFRDTSPQRHYGTPSGQPGNLAPGSSKWGSPPGQSTYANLN